MLRRLLVGLAVPVLAGSWSDAETLSIDHAAVQCVVAEKFPRLEARIAPGDAVAKAKVLFQVEGARHWYAVAMKPEGAAFSGVLPRPKKSLKAYRYYIEATDRAMGISRTAEYTTSVVDGPAACEGRVVAGALGAATVALEVPAGAPAIPAGFGSSGVSTSVAAGSAGASAGGGGLPTGVLIGGAVVAAGAAAAVVATRGNPSYKGDFSGEMTITQTSGSVTCTWTRTIRGSMDIALERSGETVSGNGYTVLTDRSVIARSGPCSGEGPGTGSGDTITGPISGTASNFTFGNPPRIGQPPCGGGGVFVGSLSGEVITGTLTITSFCEGSSPAHGETRIPVTLRR